jgi:hypothetical protein
MPILIRQKDADADRIWVRIHNKDGLIGQELAGKETYDTYLIRFSSSGHGPDPDVQKVEELRIDLLQD